MIQRLVRDSDSNGDGSNNSTGEILHDGLMDDKKLLNISKPSHTTTAK